ncbi:MAG: glycosyltransferase family 4 protein [Longimicrobiaceae bacterium]
MRLLLLNLAMDADHPILGFATRWVAALAARAESVDVITLTAGRLELPANVRVFSLGKERGYGRARMAAELYRHLLRLTAGGRVDGCFSHMAQRFSAMAGPVLRLRGIPLVTWYAHPSLTPTLRAAHWVSNRMVTSLPSAYPYRHDKLSVIGQGIDVSLFSPGGRPDPGPPLLLCAGRLSPVKDHATLLRAAALLRDREGLDFRVAVVGSPAGAHPGYAGELREQVRALGLEERVRFEPGVPMEALVGWYRRCAAHVNLTPAGFGDKVAWEAMSCGRPCLVANEDFRETLGREAGRLLFRHGDAESLARHLGALLREPPAALDAVGAYLRGQVVRLHSLDALAEKVLALLERHAPRRARRAAPALPAAGGAR